MEKWLLGMEEMLRGGQWASLNTRMRGFDLRLLMGLMGRQSERRAVKKGIWLKKVGESNGNTSRAVIEGLVRTFIAAPQS